MVEHSFLQPKLQSSLCTRCRSPTHLFDATRSGDNGGQENGNVDPLRQDMLHLQQVGQDRALDDFNRARHGAASSNVAEEHDGDEQSDSEKLNKVKQTRCGSACMPLLTRLSTISERRSLIKLKHTMRIGRK